MNEVEKNLLKNIQGAIQSGDYFFINVTILLH